MPTVSVSLFSYSLYICFPRWEFIKENKKVRKQENTLSTRKATKEKKKEKNTLSTKKATKKK